MGQNGGGTRGTGGAARAAHLCWKGRQKEATVTKIRWGFRKVPSLYQVCQRVC